MNRAFLSLLALLCVLGGQLAAADAKHTSTDAYLIEKLKAPAAR